MKEYKASTLIRASPEKIWTILIDGASWPQWDPSCEKLEGRITPGEKLKAFTKLSPGRAFPVKVSEFVPHQKMTWTGGMPLGLFKGVRTFTLTPRGDQVEFTLHEVFSGPMLALIGGSIPDMSDAFQKFVEGLKRRAET